MIHGFTAENWKHRILKPVEDSYGFGESGEVVSLAVADGITRDFKNGTPAGRDVSSAIKFLLGYYPNPSSAKDVADIFCRGFVASGKSCGVTLENKLSTRKRLVDEAMVKGIISSINVMTRKYNKNHFPNPNYLDRDLAGCVASGALIEGRDVFSGFICDCGLVVYNKKGDLVEWTSPEMTRGEGTIPGFQWSNPIHRRMWREQIRNSPYYLKIDEEIAPVILPAYRSILTPEIIKRTRFGALTGQDEAMDYVITRHYELPDDGTLMLHTDGLYNLRDDGAFIGLLRQGVASRNFSGLANFCSKNVGSEGTAVIYVPEKD